MSNIAVTEESRPSTPGTPLLTGMGRWLLPAPTMAAIAAIAIALLAALGRWQDVEVLRSGIAGLPPMRPPGILLVVLVGAGLLLTGPEPRGWRRLVAAGCAAVVMVAAFVFMLVDGEPHSGPTIAGALVFLALGLALALMQLRRPPAITVAALSVFAAVLPLYRLVEHLVVCGGSSCLDSHRGGIS